ncbi:MAG: hypothetical protein ABSB97_02960 [Thermoplasmata archaeon]
MRRGESEVTQWPRGLVDYVPAGAEEETPSPEEDRTGNRLRIAARLIGLLRAGGENVDPELATLAEAKRAYAAKEPTRATELVERLLGTLDARTRRSKGSGPTP